MKKKIPPANEGRLSMVETSVEATPMQSGIMFHCEADTGSGCYLQQCVGILEGNEPDIPAFTSAWRRLLLRHDALRTALRRDNDGRLLQDIHRYADMPILVLDWRGLEASQRELRMDALLVREQSCGIDPLVPPLHRLALCLEGSCYARFVWTSHHTILDGRSRALLLKEFFTLYNGGDVELPPAPSWVSYTKWLSRSQPFEAKDFWQLQLEGVRQQISLPSFATETLPSGESVFGETEVVLSASAWNKLRGICATHGFTTTTLIHASWAQLLCKFTMQQEAIFGAVRSCRRGGFPGEEGVVGLLINTVPMRIRLLGNEPLLGWLQQLRANWVAMQPFERTALAQAIKWAGLPPGMPLFETLVCVEERGLDAHFKVRSPSHYSLTLNAYAGDELRLNLQFDWRRFGKSFADEILNQMSAVLQAMADNPQIQVGDIAISTPRPCCLELKVAQPIRFLENPPTTTEMALMGIWERILEESSFEAHDNFFESGGDSLSLMRMVAMVVKEFGRPLPVCEALKRPTIAALSAFLDSPVAEALPQARTFANTTPSPLADLTIHSRPLEQLLDEGAMAPVGAVAIGYLPQWLPVRTQLTRQKIRRDWYGDQPFLSRIIEVPHGRIAVVTLPIFGDELYDDAPELRRLMDIALIKAGKLVARAVSLTGLIPSATDYGRNLVSAARERPLVTTGHGATAATVVLSLGQILKLVGRNMAQEYVAFLGLGSIGRSVLELALRKLPHPRSLVLCDVPGRLKELEDIPRQAGYAGEVRVRPFSGEVPDEVYESTMLVGATNAPDVLRIHRLAPGTLVVDDSGPRCFSMEEARLRFEKSADVLCMDGGVLETTGWLRQTSFLPPAAQSMLDTDSLAELTYFDGTRITGCVLSSLLTGQYGGPPTIGLADPVHCAAWFELLEKMGYRPARPHLGARSYSAEELAGFRKTYGVGDGKKSLPVTPLLSRNDDLYRVTVEFNATASDYPREQCVHERFSQMAASRPDAVALVHGQRHVSYSQLDAQSDGIAGMLLEHGVIAGDVVAVYMPRSVEMIAGFLGILKAGAAYMPLDRANPRERIAAQVSDAGIRLLLTHEEAACPAQPGVKVIVIRDGAASPLRTALPKVTPLDLAYVMYTSGTTGRAKGVEIPHRAVVRLVCGTDWVQATPDEVFFHLASPAFDFSTMELWAPLLNGARCVIYPQDVLDLAVLESEISHHKISILSLTTSVFHTVIDTCPEALYGVRHVYAGGEILSLEHTRRALTLLPRTRIFNVYGPTEVTFASCYEVPRPLPEHLSSIPIGAPIANTRIYILDEQLRPLPLGAIGELCVAGDGLARGYSGRPDLTAEKFVEAELGSAGLERLYRTGDMGRWLSDGTLEFVGRRDRQVKLRGYRIELDEIEAVLRAHGSVREAVVLLHRNGQAACLVAYVECRDSSGSLSDDLKVHLRRFLPEYMIPSAIVTVLHMPLTQSGKLDRTALSSDAQGQTLKGTQP